MERSPQRTVTVADHRVLGQVGPAHRLHFAILKRGIFGVYHHVSPKHLKRYVGEFDFRYNARGISDAARADRALRGIDGKLSS
jgi:hypothetical protein